MQTQGWVLSIGLPASLNLSLAPRAGLEPATKRLTAAHSTIELPGNEYLAHLLAGTGTDFGIFDDFPQDDLPKVLAVYVLSI